MTGARETARMVLRPWREEDAPELQRLFADPEVRGNRSISPERVVRFAEASLAQWRGHGFGPWAAIDRATGEWIGRIGLDRLDDDWPGPDRVEVGFELGRRWWGRGLATEGAREALAFGFEDHGLPRIVSVTAAAHAAARRVMEKLGLAYEGTRHWKSPDVPVVWYAMDRATWAARRAARWLLREHGIAVSGPPLREAIGAVGPERLRAAVVDIVREWWVPMLVEAARLARLGYRCYAVLTMCRTLYTLRHGTIATKPVAARWAVATLDPGWTPLIERALAWSPDAPPDLDETRALIRHTGDAAETAWRGVAEGEPSGYDESRRTGARAGERA